MIKPERFCCAIVCFVSLLSISAVRAPGQTQAGEAPRPAAMQTAESTGGFTAHNDREQLEVTVCGDSLIHVTARLLTAPASHELQPWMLSQTESCRGSAFQFSRANGVATLTTAQLAISMPERDGNLIVKTLQGETLVHERPNLPRTYLPSEASGLY
ncbi:MAG: hypothetical protein WBC92_08485, partial [Terracidiphilus sp.]